MALPLKLVGPLDAPDLGHRNTFVRGYFDDANRLVIFEQVVYGAVELRHDYQYGPDGALHRALITMDGEETVVNVQEHRSRSPG